ncbi:MAG: KpsF/GutQ family sugar-phosphate isomerase, partial [Bdellovibrionota bacterium]
GKIVVTGVGKSGKVGQKIAATLSSTGSFAVFLHPTEGLHGDLGLVSSRDVIVAISYTGNTEELVRLLPSLKSLRVPIIAISGNRSSALAEQCDAMIDAYVEAEACPHNLAPTTSTTLTLALGDAMAMALMQLRGFDAKSFALNHPGGSLGRRLNLKVSDVMQRGEAVATVTADASMDDVIMALTRKMQGGVLVVDGPKLLGLITEGDVRRALKHREKFFTMKASQIMTSKPITTTPETLAHSALALMENRPTEISILAVVETPGSDHWAGIVRVHDLVKAF